MDRIELRSPPVLERAEAGGALLGALPLVGSLGSIGLVATMAGGHRQYVGIGLFVATTLLVAALQLARHHRQRVRILADARRDYLVHLASVRARVRAAGESHRAEAVARHPPPRALPALAEVGAWRRREGLTVRYGTADLPLDAAPAAPEIAARADPHCSAAVRRLVAAHASHPGLPATVDLGETRRLTAPRGTARAVVCSAAGCRQVVIAVLASPAAQAAWEWVKWLPSGSPLTDAVGPQRPISASMIDLMPHLPQGRHLLLVVDGVPPPVLDTNATVLGVDSRLAADDRPLPGTPDDCTSEVAEAFARRSGVEAGVSFPTVPDWAPRPPGDHLRVPLGAADDGAEVVLDLKESALGGSGPHGMVIGATGSGKSELLRALVLRLALAHPPAQLNLVLIDFKGGAAFDGLARLPHVSALITNLADELDLLDRMADALTSELVRRQEVVRVADGDRTSLPTLLVVVDEFAELLSARPELDELFATIGRLGRGLGVHLLLASQRLDGGRWRGLESHLSFRIGLRTFTAEESRAVLGVVDAYELPPEPGLGYLRTDSRTLVRFRAPYVGARVGPTPHPQRVLPFTAAPVDAPAPTPGAPVTCVDAAVAAMRRYGGAAHRIWLPPLDRSTPIGELLPDLAVDGARGFGQASRTIPVGEIDRPLVQRRDRLEIDLADGHVAIVGVGGSGRSTLLRTAVAGLALTRTPDEVEIHLLDLGGALAPLARLPHVASIVGRSEPDLAIRLLQELARGPDRPAVLVVDGWGRLRQDLPEVEDALTRIVLHGRTTGVHVLASATRWGDLRASVRDEFGTRLELRLGDPLDSEIDRRLAAAVPRGRPGRGIVDGGHFLAALPSLEAGADADTALSSLVSTVDRHWHGRRPRRLRPLPTQVTLADLPTGDRIRLGLREGDLAPCTLPSDGHLIVLGDGGSGRTSLLRTIIREITRTRPSDQVVLVDPRATLRGALAADQLLSHVTGDPAATLAELARSLAGRVGSREPRGPDVWVLVDDLELMPPSSWQALLPVLPRAADLGLHVVVTRRTGGAARAFYEPLLGSLRESGSPGVLLSGSAEEGPLLGGVRARSEPPGRARWVGTDGEADPIQVAWTTP